MYLAAILWLDSVTIMSFNNDRCSEIEASDVLLFCAQCNSLLGVVNLSSLSNSELYHCESIILKSSICNTSQVSLVQHSLVAKAIQMRHQIVLSINLLQEVVYYMVRT